jgi:leader peptidase (prepilin peptidase)/N-methyltransferase
MEVATSLIFALFGLVIGSFLNVVIDRLPANQSLLKPPSHCPGCQKRLSAADLIPLLSYLWLNGRCRYCGARIPMRIFWVELAMGMGFGLLSWYVGLTPELAVALFYFCLLLTIGVIDLEQGLILNWLVYPAIVIALVISVFSPDLTNEHFIIPSIVRAAIGGGIGFVLFLLIALVSRGGMGLGDVKMAALMGVMLGYPVIFVAVFLAVISGGLVAIALMLLKVKGRKQTIPFGPFLALGTFLALFWGQMIMDWYLGFFT